MPAAVRQHATREANPNRGYQVSGNPFLVNNKSQKFICSLNTILFIGLKAFWYNY